MNMTVEQVVQATPEVNDLIGELENVLGAAYEAHQRHGLSIDQLFEPNVRFFIAPLENLAVGCGGVALFDDYAEVVVRVSMAEAVDPQLQQVLADYESPRKAALRWSKIVCMCIARYDMVEDQG